jgi:hypothetical protein
LIGEYDLLQALRGELLPGGVAGGELYELVPAI